MKYKKLLAMTFAVSILAAVPTSDLVFAESIDNKIATEEKKINELSNQEKQINAELAGLETTIKELSAEKENLMNEKLGLEKDVNKISKEIKELEKVIAKRSDKIAKQARSAQINQDEQDLLNVILESSSLSDAVGRTVAYRTLITNNVDIIEAQKKDQEELARKQKELEEKVQEILAKAEELRIKEQDLENSKKEQLKVAQTILKNLEGAKGKKETLVAQKAEAERIQRENAERARQMAAQVKAAQAAQKKAEDAINSKPTSLGKTTSKPGASNNSTNNNQSVLSTSGFQRPLSSINITSGFGGRVDPTGSAGNFHDGIDMSGALNTPVFASRAGVVVESSYHPSAGNHVIIKHDNGYYTYYMHFNSLGVASGTNVNAGDVVGLMGTTGNSTGVHLHFGISTGLWSGFMDPSPFIGI
ncbi:murein hydrolase activator EnvC family protein [Vagococcus sp.]|uniref:murein hydrolase activator EnvC family protein n=1 Tax=Vagococcus sp. TaxID=1933889 RepID=UPI003F9BFEC1